MFTTSTEGTLRVRRHDDGDMDVWVQGWRLEIRFLWLLPALMALGFAFSSIFIPLRILGCAGLIGTAFVVHRLTQVGIRLSAMGVTLNDLVRSHDVLWDDVVTFVGERTRHDGKVVLLLKDGSKVPAPGSLTGEDMNPIGDEGDLSVVEELNRLTARYRAELPAVLPRPDAADKRRLRVRAKGPATRPRAIEPPPPVGDLPAGPPPPTEVPPAASTLPPALRHPHVPRPPKPELEAEPTGRARRARRRRRADAAPLIEVPDTEGMSPGARRLASMDDQGERR